MSTNFFSLTPDTVLSAVERSGHATTGLCYALNSLENRVYEVELDDRSRIVGKFYRPGRWSRDTILDEHRLLHALVGEEVPACAPITFSDGETLAQTEDGIFFALFPRTGGRSPDELTDPEYEQLGRFLARIHNVSASLNLVHRPRISPESYGSECLAIIDRKATMSPGVRARYFDAAKRIIEIGDRRFESIDTFVVHGDCHRANLLRRDDRFFFLDFDDMGNGPAVQDFWLLLPARAADCPEQVDALITGYQQFRDFDRASLNLVEILRALRYVRYAAWISERWDDPAFPRAFPNWGTDNYWEQQVADLHEQLRLFDASPV